MDVDAEPVGGPRVAPHHRVVADDAAGRMVQGRENRIARVVTEVEAGDQPRDLRGPDEPAVYAHEPVDFGPDVEPGHGRVGVRQGEMPLLGEEQVVVQLVAEPLVHLHAPGVERDALRSAVVAADDGRVAPAAAAPDIAHLEHGDAGHAELGEVIGRRQPVDSAAHDHHVVARLQLALSPHPLAGEELTHRQSPRSSAAAPARRTAVGTPASNNASQAYSP